MQTADEFSFHNYIVQESDPYVPNCDYSVIVMASDGSKGDDDQDLLHGESEAASSACLNIGSSSSSPSGTIRT